MKKTRNIVIAALACILVAGISIPVIASNLYGREEKTVKELSVSEFDALPQARAVSVVEKAAQETEAESQAVSNGSQICASYVDENGDGVCDHCVVGSAQNRCANYVDENGDGVCDHCVNGSAQNQGGGNGYGHHGGGHHAERRGHHGR